ncbi:hypothetical protein CBL_04939 [Carabus blaptoides fortunei]
MARGRTPVGSIRGKPGHARRETIETAAEVVTKQANSPASSGCSVDFRTTGPRRSAQYLTAGWQPGWYKCEAKTQSPCCLAPGGEQLAYEFRDEPKGHKERLRKYVDPRNSALEAGSFVTIQPSPLCAVRTTNQHLVSRTMDCVTDGVRFVRKLEGRFLNFNAYTAERARSNNLNLFQSTTNGLISLTLECSYRPGRNQVGCVVLSGQEKPIVIMNVIDSHYGS